MCIACFGFSFSAQQLWVGYSGGFDSLLFLTAFYGPHCSNKTCQPACLFARGSFLGSGRTPWGTKEQAYLFALQATGVGPTMGG